MNESRKAVVIGCGNFDSDAIPNLKYAENDAREVYEYLINPDIGNFLTENVKLVLGPTVQELRVLLHDTLLRAEKNDLILIYYAGHGLVESDTGCMFLATSDTEIDSKGVTSIPTTDIRNWLNKSRSKRICTILDCCHGGAFGTQTRSASEMENVEAGLSQMSGEGRIIMSSCQSSQQARELSTVQHGIFTHHMLNGMNGEADSNDDGIISAEEIYTYVSDKMEKDLGRAQRPTIKSDMAGGEFYLVMSGRKRASIIAELASKLEELNEEKLYTNALHELDVFSKGPSGRDGELDELRRTILEKQETDRKAYKHRVHALAGNEVISNQTLNGIIQAIDETPSRLFEENNEKNSHWYIIRQHLLGNIADISLENLWPNEAPEIVEPPITKPPEQDKTDQGKEDSRDKSTDDKLVATGSSRWLAFKSLTPIKKKLLYTGIIILVIASAALTRLLIQPTPDTSLETIIVFNSGTEDEVTEAYTVLFDEINKRLEGIHGEQQSSAPLFQFDLNSIDLRRIDNISNIQGIVSEFIRGEADIVGVLSPIFIHEMEKNDAASPFIVPLYDGSSNYESVIFTTIDRVLQQDLGKGIFESKPATLTNLIRQSLQSRNAFIALTSEVSASGYWYPRKELIDRISSDSLNEDNIRFDDIVITEMNTEDMLAAVSTGDQGIVAGAMAKFRYTSACPTADDIIVGPPTAPNEFCNNLIPVFEIQGIPQGAFMTSNVLMEEHRNFIRTLDSEWPGAVAIARRQLGCSTASTSVACNTILVERWNPPADNAYLGLELVFDVQDPVEAQSQQSIVRIIIVGIVFLVAFCLLYALYGRKPHST